MASDRATILIVDDMPDNLALVSGLLTPDYHVKVAISGAKALQICHPHAPDLILLDIMMPEMDGFEVLRRLRADPATAGIPVIFLTALADARDEERGFALGAVDYITKPISPPTLLARVRSHTALARQTTVLRTLAGKLAHYLPPQLYQSIFEGRQEVAIRAERKMLTVFFSDIKDFTQTTDEMEPEDLTYLINDYFSEMSRIALDHGATIDKFIGDAMLVFFGDPESRGEKGDALQCVRMAVAMQRHMSVLQRRWATHGFNKPFHMRIGIHTGYCNVGNFGSEQRMDYTIIGGAVNLAARLQQAGEADGILLSHKTYTLVADEFEALERAPLLVKGIAREIRCFALQGVLADTLQDPHFIVRSQPGLQLSVDVRLEGAARDEAVRTLSEALATLQGGPAS
ncbi:MAG: adenylate/guanylate cyclase domain-containing protein [Rhodoferax sp.]